MAFTSPVFDALTGELTGSDSRFAAQLGGCLHNAGEPEGASHTSWSPQLTSTVHQDLVRLQIRRLQEGVAIERFSQFQLWFVFLLNILHVDNPTARKRQGEGVLCIYYSMPKILFQNLNLLRSLLCKR